MSYDQRGAVQRDRSDDFVPGLGGFYPPPNTSIPSPLALKISLDRTQTGCWSKVEVWCPLNWDCSEICVYQLTICELRWLAQPTYKHSRPPFGPMPHALLRRRSYSWPAGHTKTDGSIRGAGRRTNPFYFSTSHSRGKSQHSCIGGDGVGTRLRCRGKKSGGFLLRQRIR